MGLPQGKIPPGVTVSTFAMGSNLHPIRTIIAALLCCVALGGGPTQAQKPPADSSKTAHQMARTEDAKLKEWQAIWEKDIVSDAQNRYCDTAMGEDIGWLMYPFLQGFYYGYMATDDTEWIDREIDCADSWIKRAVIEPDGYPGWPKVGASGTPVDHFDQLYCDSLLGEAMVMRPIVLLSKKILETPALKGKYGAKAESYIKRSEQLYEKWDKRGAWRETADGGMISIVVPFGIDQTTGKWTDGYETRNAPTNGCSHPDNKANLTACWLLAMFDATQKPVYRDRAEKWFRLMKLRMHLSDDDKTFKIWNYNEPAGPWDYKPDGSPKHWIGVHPNAGYYAIDVTGIVNAYEHGLVFTKDDLDHLVATALAEKRYWNALAPYDDTIQQKFEESLKPDSWAGHEATPWYLSLQAQLRKAQ
jgi:hypothetical protein